MIERKSQSCERRTKNAKKYVFRDCILVLFAPFYLVALTFPFFDSFRLFEYSRKKHLASTKNHQFIDESRPKASDTIHRFRGFAAHLTLRKRAKSSSYPS